MTTKTATEPTANKVENARLNLEWETKGAERSEESAKASVLRAVETMQKFVDDARKSASREGKPAAELAGQVLRDLAWGLANAQSHLDDAVRESAQAASRREAALRHLLDDLETE